VVLSAKVTWTKEENEALRQAVKEYVVKSRGSKTMVNVFFHLPWTKIAEKIPSKTNDQCCRHWLVSTLAAWCIPCLPLLISCCTGIKLNTKLQSYFVVVLWFWQSCVIIYILIVFLFTLFMYVLTC